MSTLYETKVSVVGGRNGTVRSEDGILDLSLAMPKELGGKGGATNPEQLFAAGYAACFESAIMHVARGSDVKIKDDQIEVVATVGLVPNDTAFRLTVALDVAYTGVDRETAEKLTETAHQVCPYSNATRGNIDVAISVTAN